MKKLALFMAMLFAICVFDTLAETISAGIWAIDYFLDEFRMPTDEAYIHIAKPIEGIFSNSETTDAKLKVDILLDENNVAIKLYENDTDLVKNGTSDSRSYTVKIRDSEGGTISLQGTMYGQTDRIVFDYDSETILRTLLSYPSVSFYIEEKEKPVTNYLIAIESTDGLNDMVEALNNIYDDRDYLAAVSLWDAGQYKEALSVFASLGDYKDSEEWDSKYRALMYTQAEKLLAERKYESANNAFIEARDYADANSRVGEPFYVQAEELLKKGDLYGAKVAFQKAGSYGDAVDRYEKIVFDQSNTEDKLQQLQVGPAAIPMSRQPTVPSTASENGKIGITGCYVSEVDDNKLMVLAGFGYVDVEGFDGENARSWLIITQIDNEQSIGYPLSLEEGISGFVHKNAVCQNANASDFVITLDVSNYTDGIYSLALVIGYEPTDVKRPTYGFFPFDNDTSFTVLNGQVVEPIKSLITSD